MKKTWIGVTRFWSRGCSLPVSVPDWSGKPLFPLDRLEPDLRASLRRADLDRFCVYEYTGTAVPPPALPPEISAGLRSAERDRVAFAGSADALEDMTLNPFYQRFRGQVQLLAAPIQGTSPIRLAFLDTQPDGEGIPLLAPDTADRLALPFEAKKPEPAKPEPRPEPPGTPEPDDPDAPRWTSGHGYTLTHIAGHLVGGEGSSVQIASRLALPVVKFDSAAGELKRDETSGGVRGTFEDLSQALVEEVSAWKALPESRRPPHLVLNLSVGWDGDKLGGWERRLEDMSPNVQAIYRALRVAAEQGVLVIAAAGNERPGLGETVNPLLPAGWERLAEEKRPLVYAVSGVDGQGHPLVSTRARGEAPRVAYADHVVVPDLNAPDRRRPTATLTGTSVATAVVSATAAAVWSYRPDLKPAEVMQVLQRAGDLLPRKPDFYAPTEASPEPVRRISLCHALYQACSPTEARCPTPVCPAPPAVSPLEAELSDFEPEIERTDLAFAEYPVGPLLPNLLDQPGILPQPGLDPCPNCTVTRNPPAVVGPSLAAAFVKASSSFVASGLAETSYKLRVAIPSTWAEGTLQDAALEVTGFDPVTGRKVRLERCPIEAAPPLGGGRTLEATCSGDPAGPFQATLSFTVLPASGGPALSIVSPLFVEDE